MKKLMMTRVAMLTIACICCMACDKNDPVNPDPTPTPSPTPGGTTIAITGITLNKSSIELKINEREALTATITPANASVKTVSWSSSNEAVAKVSTGGEVTAVSAGSATITAKGGNVKATCTVTVKKDEKPMEPIEVKMEGTINHTTYTAGQKGSVSFNRFPATVDEFKLIRDKIGHEPQGAVALDLMAYEMYRRDRTIGEEVIKLTNTTLQVPGVIRRLKELFGTDLNYSRPYLVAAYLKGATPENGYAPTKPYTVEVIVDKGRKYEKSNTYQTTIISLMVLTKGADSNRSISVMKTKKPGEPGENGKFFIVQNDGLRTQVKAISFEHPFKGLD